MNYTHARSRGWSYKKMESELIRESLARDIRIKLGGKNYTQKKSVGCEYKNGRKKLYAEGYSNRYAYNLGSSI